MAGDRTGGKPDEAEEMMTDLPTLREFRIEPSRDGIIHLVFDMPGRTMNVFSNAAIHEIGLFADWLKSSDVRGVVLRSGKDTAFCAGADLNELGVAYDMIMASPKAARGKTAFDHFFPLSRGLRALETAGKPVAAAIAGLALGGGCEFALAAHYRVVTDSPRTALGLPESLVGLLPGAGGTQRLPRVIGVAGALPVLLDGKRIGATEALSTGLAQAVVAPGDEVAAAEDWILSDPDPRQPWDRPEWREASDSDVRDLLERAWASALADPGDHYPAPFAILDCIRGGIVKPMDRAIEWEMDVFSRLIQRPEPRNMIQSLFLGKLEHDKRAKTGTLPPTLDRIEAEIMGVLRGEIEAAKAAGTADTTVSDALDTLGMQGLKDRIEAAAPMAPVQVATGGCGAEAHFWFERPLSDADDMLSARLLARMAGVAAGHGDAVSPDDQRLIDYGIIRRLGFPAYLGGPFALARHLGLDGIRRLVA